MSREERWQLSGNAAEFYERYVRLLMEPWVHCLVDVAALQPAEHVLDVACGTGFVARLAADCVGATGRVVGIDLNAGMIEAARAASGQGAANTMSGEPAMPQPYHSRAVSSMWSSVSKACSSSPIASRHCWRCVVFSASEVGWPSRCGALSATRPTTRPSPVRWRDTM